MIHAEILVDSIFENDKKFYSDSGCNNGLDSQTPAITFWVFQENSWGFSSILPSLFIIGVIPVSDNRSFFSIHFFFHQDILNYSFMSLALHPCLSGPWKPPTTLSSSLTTFGWFFLQYISIFCFTTCVDDLRRHFIYPQKFFYLIFLPHIWC